MMRINNLPLFQEFPYYLGYVSSVPAERGLLHKGTLHLTVTPILPPRTETCGWANPVFELNHKIKDQ